MKVFIGNLPGKTILTELKEFLGVMELKADFHFFKGRDAKARRYHFLVAARRHKKKVWSSLPD